MRLAVLLLPLCLAAPARAARYAADPPSVSLEAEPGLTGGFFRTLFEAGAPFDHDRYRISARLRSLRYSGGFKGTSVEYSAALRRELYHATIAGRLATQPPNAQRSAYHLAQGDVIFTFHGWDLGPEHPELSPVVWESSGPAPAPERIASDWVTQLAGRYTNTDHHIERTPPGGLVLIQNTWQAALRETWKRRASLALHAGFDRYDKPVEGATPAVYLDNVERPGSVFPVFGWPSNYVGADGWTRCGPFTLSAGLTRLNMRLGARELHYGTKLGWSPKEDWLFTLGYHRRKRAGAESREALSLSAQRSF